MDMVIVLFIQGVEVDPSTLATHMTSATSDNLSGNLRLDAQILLLHLLFQGVLDPPETPSPFTSLVPLDLHALLGTRHRGKQDRVVGIQKLLRGDVFEEGVEVKVVHHPVV